MSYSDPEPTRDGLATAGPSGLSPEQSTALSEAADMIAGGHSQEDAVDHLVANDMPRVVAKVLVKQYDRTKSN